MLARAWRFKSSPGHQSKNLSNPHFANANFAPRKPIGLFQLRARSACVGWLTAVPRYISTYTPQRPKLTTYQVALLRNNASRDKRRHNCNSDNARGKPTNSLCRVLGQAHDSRPRNAADVRPRMLGQLPVAQARRHRPVPRGSLQNDRVQCHHLQRHR